jgi:protein O-mannosyl-transferase
LRSPGNRSTSAATATIAVAVAVLGFLAYWNTLNNAFVWDDVSSILIHEHVQDPAKIGQLFKEDQHAFGRGQGNFYRPLLSVTFMLDYQLATGGETPTRTGGVPDISPLVFHISSILWHVFAALALLLLLARAGTPIFVQAATTLIYVAHPLHTEAVAYISGRADSMAAAFVFLGLYFAFAPPPAWRMVMGAVLSLLCFAGAVLSKESGAMLPVLLLLAALCRIRMLDERPGKRTRAIYFLPALFTGAGLLVYGVLRSTVLRFAEAEDGATAPLLQRAIEAGQAFALYLKLLFWPVHLHMERSLAGVPGWLALLGASGFIVCLALAIYGFKKKRLDLSMGMGLFLITWFPISGLIPLNAPMAEHWLYVPMAGFWWALFGLLFTLVPDLYRNRVVVPVIAGLCLVFTALTIERNRDWRDNITLFEATLAQNPDTLRVRYNLAVAYELAEDWDAARSQYEHVLDMYQRQRQRLVDDRLVWPQELEAHISLGDIAIHQDRPDDALRHYDKVLARAGTPTFIQYWLRAALGSGRSLMAQGNDDLARERLAPIKERFPDLAPEIDAILEESAADSDIIGEEE